MLIMHQLHNQSSLNI